MSRFQYFLSRLFSFQFSESPIVLQGFGFLHPNPPLNLYGGVGRYHFVVEGCYKMMV